MTIRQSPPSAGGRSRMTPSAPMPRRRSQSRGASAAGSPGNPSRASTQTKSFAVPCSFAKRSVAMSAELRRDTLAADQILERLAFPYNVVARTVNQDSRGTRPRVVVRRHHVTVRTRAHDRQQVAGPDLLELAVLGEEVAALAHGPDDVGDDRGAAARPHGLDRLVGAVERRSDEVVHRAVDHDEPPGSGVLPIEDLRHEHPRVADHGPPRLQHERAIETPAPRLDRGRVLGRRGWDLVLVGDAEAAAAVEVAEAEALGDEPPGQLADARQRVTEGRDLRQL